jgi:hypothetical protein
MERCLLLAGGGSVLALKTLDSTPHPNAGDYSENEGNEAQAELEPGKDQVSTNCQLRYAQEHEDAAKDACDYARHSITI